MANKIEELPVFRRAMDFWSAVHAILNNSALRKDRDLWGQINDANDSVPSNMREGFEQGSDAGFIPYLFRAKGSLGEIFCG